MKHNLSQRLKTYFHGCFCWISANPLGAILADIIDPSFIQTYKKHVNNCDWVDLMSQELIFIFDDANQEEVTLLLLR